MPEYAISDMISGLNHITLAVRDIDCSFRFYVETWDQGRWRDEVEDPICSSAICACV